MKTNIKLAPKTNYEGARIGRISPESELRRTVLSCLLFEDQFYENGVSIAQRIKDLVPQVAPQVVAEIAYSARVANHLRHVPLLVAREMARYNDYKPFVPDLLNSIIQRPDELAEFLSLYWLEGKTPIANCVKKGLARAFTKFDAFSLAKWNRDGAIKLRDVLFLCHAKPKDDEQAALWKKLINNELAVPDSWETAISVPGVDKTKEWTRLLEEGKLGAMALLRNLRNMIQAGVPEKLIKAALLKCNPDKVLPYRFISAAKYAPNLEPELEALMMKNLNAMNKLKGRTLLLIDRSGSMTHRVSAKSEITRIEAACGLAILARELCEECVIYGFARGETLIPNRRGFALRDAVMNGFGGGTQLRKSMDAINAKEKCDRTIVFSDEESEDGVGNFQGRGYMCNVASTKNGIGYDKCIHIHGFSEASLAFIQEYENGQ